MSAVPTYPSRTVLSSGLQLSSCLSSARFPVMAKPCPPLPVCWSRSTPGVLRACAVCKVRVGGEPRLVQNIFAAVRIFPLVSHSAAVTLSAEQAQSRCGAGPGRGTACVRPAVGEHFSSGTGESGACLRMGAVCDLPLMESQHPESEKDAQHDQADSCSSSGQNGPFCFFFFSGGAADSLWEAPQKAQKTAPSPISR